MRSRRSRNDSATMDLFPFMAVLICTVGALIMLLVVMVQQARVKASGPSEAQQMAEMRATEQAQQEQARREQQRQAQLKAHEQKQQIADKKKAEFDEYKWKADLLRSSYEAAVGQIEEQRLALSHLESHTRELSAQAGKMQAEADLIAEAAKRERLDDQDSKTQLDDLKQAIASAKTELANAKEELENVDPKYVLVPYTGAQGTNRRPIYIECLPDRVILQPEGILLIDEDFLAPITAENPMARALRAKREFLLENELIRPDAEPYPLLVVRPGAAASYSAARSAMKAWESEFGYELVENDVELDYFDPDPRLKQLLEDVVLETRGRRRMMRSMRRDIVRKPRERLRPSSTGGFETVGGGGNSTSGSMQNDYTDHLPFETQTAQRSRPGYPNQASSSSGPFSYGNATPPVGQQANPRAAGLSSGTSGFGSGDYDAGGFANRGNNSGNVSPERTSRFTNGQADNPGKFDQAPGSMEPSSGETSDQPFASSLGESSTSSTTSRFGGKVGPEQFDSATAGSSSLAGQQNRFNAGGPGGPSNQPGGGGSSAEARGQGGQGATGSGGNSTMATAQRSMSVGMSGASSPNSLASSRGSGWAISPQQPDAVGIQRPIHVTCDNQHIALLPEKGTQQKLQSWQHRGSTERIVDAFVQAVQERMQSWGIAGQGIYWKPVLKIKVNDGAETAYEHLLHLLNDSGIQVTRQP